MIKSTSIITFGALAVFATSSYADGQKQTKVKVKTEKEVKLSGVCEKEGDPANSGCNTPDKCGGPVKIEAKDKADCEKQGGAWKQPEAKK